MKWAEFKPKFLAALRSGEYSQDKGRLRTVNGFCCLGVACDVLLKEEPEKFKVGWSGELNDTGEFLFEGVGDLIPSSVKIDDIPQNIIKFYGNCWQFKILNAPISEVEDSLEEFCASYVLSMLNDEIELDFNQIADLVEKYTPN